MDEKALEAEYKFLKDQFPLVSMIEPTLYRGMIRCERGVVKEYAKQKVWPFTEYVKWQTFELELDPSHPFKPPVCTWKTDIPHPNIIPNQKGQVCVSVLGEGWTPKTKLAAVVNALSFLLSDPNPDSTYPFPSCINSAKICKKYGFPKRMVKDDESDVQGSNEIRIMSPNETQHQTPGPIQPSQGQYQQQPPPAPQPQYGPPQNPPSAPPNQYQQYQQQPQPQYGPPHAPPNRYQQQNYQHQQYQQPQYQPQQQYRPPQPTPAYQQQYQQPASQPAPQSHHSGDDRVERLRLAYEEGRITRELYETNLENLGYETPHEDPDQPYLPPPPPADSPAPENEGNVTRLRCPSCHLAFTVNSGQTQIQCPYCGVSGNL